MSRDEPVADAVISALFDAGADAVVVVDEAGRITLANAACERLLGHSPAALVGQPLAILVPERFREHARQHDAYMADPRPRGMGTGLPLRARHADGGEVPVDIALTPLVVDGRRWAAAAIRDMRGRLHGPETLRVQATALRSAANGIVITDRAGVITW